MPITLLTTALALAVALLVYQTARARVMARCGSWQVGSQGAYHWRLPQWAALARLAPVDIIHADIDRLKHLNASLGEARVNALLTAALRRSDLYRSQHGDELVLVVGWRHDGVDVARSLAARLAALPLTDAERAAVGQISMTMVVMRQVVDVRGALADAVRLREELKAHGHRGATLVVEPHGGVQHA